MACECTGHYFIAPYSLNPLLLTVCSILTPLCKTLQCEPLKQDSLSILHKDDDVYVINEYQLISVNSNLYINHSGKGARISSIALAHILEQLQQFKKLEISDDELLHLAEKHSIDANELKHVLIQKLRIMKPMLSRKFPLVYLSSDDPIVADLLCETLGNQYNVSVVPTDFTRFKRNSLVLCYRHNYSNPDFRTILQNLDDRVYLVTAGVIHKLLIIDNLYIKNSGLPSHFSNLHQLYAFLKSDIPATKNNWLLFYRELFKNQTDQFPDSAVNACQKGYIAYSLHQFASQYTNLWNAPTPLDQINCFWQVDLTNFSVHTEASVHSPLSEIDMKLNLNHSKEMA